MSELTKDHRLAGKEKAWRTQAWEELMELYSVSQPNSSPETLKSQKGLRYPEEDKTMLPQEAPQN